MPSIQPSHVKTTFVKPSAKVKNSIFRGILTILYIETLAKHDTYNMNKNWIDDLSHFDYLKNLESTKENMPVGFFIKISKLFLGLP